MNNATSTSAVYFSGMFPSGTFNGKLIYVGFPLECIYDVAKRKSVFSDSWNFFFSNVVTSIYNLEEQSFSVYPNPAKDNITVIGKDEIQTIELFNINGQVIKSIQCNCKIQTIELNDLNDGLYILRGKTLTGFFTKKIVKQND